MYSEKKQELADTLELKRPAVLAVSGAHNSGKTTLLEKLLPVLRSRGLKVGVIKHDGHQFTPDVPGTDSFVHLSVGFFLLLLLSRSLQMYQIQQAVLYLRLSAALLQHQQMPLMLSRNLSWKSLPFQLLLQ